MTESMFNNRIMCCFMFIFVAINIHVSNAYFADWGVLGARPQEPTCVKIPDDMYLCSGIDYDQMRLPNLLDHGSVQEAQQQSGSWVPLLNVRCHPDTQLFLCSLFSPVCLETAIYPCRSLCTSVRDACESRMMTYGYHWPDMLKCENFPLDNDMCIKAMHSTPSPAEGPCEVCSPVETYENILDNFCRSDFVMRIKFRKQRNHQLLGRKPRIYKKKASIPSNLLKNTKISMTAGASCCSLKVSSKPYLVMGVVQGTTLIPTFILPWSKFKKLRHPIKKFQSLNCTDSNLFTTTVYEATKVQTTPSTIKKTSKSGKRGKKKHHKTENDISLNYLPGIVNGNPVTNVTTAIPDEEQKKKKRKGKKRNKNSKSTSPPQVNKEKRRRKSKKSKDPKD